MGKYLSIEAKRRIMSYLANSGYNITSLSKEIGMARESLSSRMNGKTDFSKSEMEAISNCLKVRPELIFFEN